VRQEEDSDGVGQEDLEGVGVGAGGRGLRWCGARVAQGLGGFGPGAPQQLHRW
jgi:hypothetical protein